MPRVQVPAGNIVERRPDTGARFQAANNNGGALGGLGAGLQQAGTSLSQFADTQNRIDAQFDEAATKQQLTQYATFRSSLLSTGENAFLTTQGQNALLARPTTEKALDDKIKELAGGLKSQRAQDLFSAAITAERTRDGEAIAGHATRQVNVWHDQTDVALQASAGQDFVGATMRGDTDAADFARGTLTNSLRAQYARNGLTGEPEKLAMSKAMSALHSSVVDAKSQADPVGAAAYLATHETELLPTDRAKLADSLYEPLLERQASAVVDGYVGHATGAPPPPTAASTGGGSTHARRVAITAISESGSRDFAKSGAPITSPVGAKYAMQVMPATARDPGYGIKPAQNDSPAEYNRVGRELLGKFNEIYGDPAKAWAAYNWSKGGVDRVAAAHGSDWLKHTPKETQGYVRKNMAMLGGNDTPTYEPRRDDLAGIYAYIQEQNLPFDVEKAALAEADRRVARNDRLLNRQQDDAKDAAYGVIDRLGDGFTSLNQIPAGVRRNLSPEALHSLKAQADQNAKPKAIEGNGNTALELELMAIRDPDAFQKADLRLVRHQVTAAEFASLAKDQAKLRSSPPEQKKTANIRSEIHSAIQFYGQDAGIADIAKRGNPDAQRRYMAISGSMRTYLDRVTENGKRAPTDDEYRQAFNSATMKVVERGAGWLGGDVERPIYDVKPGTRVGVPIPTAVRSRIVQSFRKSGTTTPSEDQIARTYVSNRGRPGFWE